MSAHASSHEGRREHLPLRRRRRRDEMLLDELVHGAASTTRELDELLWSQAAAGAGARTGSPENELYLALPR